MLARIAPLVGLLALAACGDDPPPSYEVELTTSDSNLAADGSEGATISIGVYDSNTGSPAPLGDTVPIQCTDDQGTPTGRLGSSTETGVTMVTLNTVGIASTDFRCSEDRGEQYDVVCRGIYDGEVGTLFLRCR